VSPREARSALGRCTLGSAARGIGYALAGGGLLVALALASCTIVPALLGWGSFVVLTGSMEPAIPVGSIVVTRPTPTSQLRPGDVVTFHAEGYPLVTHRVVRLELSTSGWGIRTRGDANPVEDVWTVGGGDLVGTVVATVPRVGYVLQAVNSDAGRAALGVLLVALFARNLRRGATAPEPAAAA
jgi:signal peptidase I